jgi:alpha-beta hydrolase superfamily lysophospholipase
MSEAAPLIETPEAQAPAGAEAAWIRGSGGARLRAALFAPAGRPRGSIVLSGGRTEPIEKYYETIGDLLARGFVVLAHDWRGQGLSHRDLADPLKGHARGYGAYLADFRILLNAYEARLPRPWLALGHSMGGCLTLLALAHGERRFSGAILSAPMLGLRTGAVSLPVARVVSRLNVLLGRAGGYALRDSPRPFEEPFEANILTHDPVRFARTCALFRAEPRLALGSPTWGWLDFAFRATAWLARPERLAGVTIPVTIVSAEDDKLVDNAAQAAAVRHLPQGKLISVPRAYHEILMETDEMRNIFLRALDALTGRAAPKPSEPAKPVAEAPKPAAAPAPAPAPAVEAPKPAPAAAAPAAKKPATKKPAAKAPAKKPAAKPAAAKPAAKKPAAKAPAKAAAAAKPAAKKAPAKKPAPAAAKASPAKKPAAKTPAGKKPAAKKTTPTT